MELLRANLVDEYLPGRFRLHDLLREYSTDLLAGEPEKDRLAAAARMIDSYLYGAMAADAMLQPQRLRIVVPPPPPDVGLAEIPDYRRALDWWGLEQQLAVSAVDLAVQCGLDRQAWQLAWALDTYLRRHSHPRVREHAR